MSYIPAEQLDELLLSGEITQEEYDQYLDEKYLDGYDYREEFNLKRVPKIVKIIKSFLNLIL